jgi:hypothetical protein
MNSWTSNCLKYCCGEYTKGGTGSCERGVVRESDKTMSGSQKAGVFLPGCNKKAIVPSE